MYLDIFTSVMSRNMNIELLTISTDNIWKLCGLELKDILIQQEFNFIGNDRTVIPERERTLTVNIQASCKLLI